MLSFFGKIGKYLSFFGVSFTVDVSRVVILILEIACICDELYHESTRATDE